jgi:hypothetical protein
MRVDSAPFHLTSIQSKGIADMDPHVHISATHLLASVAATVAIFGTIHLLALGVDNRASRAWIALGL